MGAKVVRVMVVEDVPDFQDIIAFTLSSEPNAEIVHVAKTGEEALEAFAKLSPELVLLDFQLPGIDGLEAAKRMKEQSPNVKIALVSAYPEEALGHVARMAKIDDVIPKMDFGPQRVRELLKRVLNPTN